MSKRKDCYGASPNDRSDPFGHTYTCRTRNCPYMVDCVKEMGKRKTYLKIMQSLRRPKVVKGNRAEEVKTLASRII